MFVNVAVVAAKSLFYRRATYQTGNTYLTKEMIRHIFLYSVLWSPETNALYNIFCKFSGDFLLPMNAIKIFNFQLSTLFHTIYSIDIDNYFYNTFRTIYYKEA